MDRTKADKIESNIVALKNELDNYYMGRDGSQQAVKDLSARIFEIVHGFDATATPALLAACEAMISRWENDHTEWNRKTQAFPPYDQKRDSTEIKQARGAIAAVRPATEPVE